MCVALDQSIYQINQIGYCLHERDAVNLYTIVHNNDYACYDWFHMSIL